MTYAPFTMFAFRSSIDDPSPTMWPVASPAGTPERAEPAPAAPDVEVMEEEETEERLNDPWVVILYNDEIHSFDEVIEQLVKATHCSVKQAEKHAWTVHTKGKDVVYKSTFEECFQVQGVLREIQLVTEIKG